MRHLRLTASIAMVLSASTVIGTPLGLVDDFSDASLAEYTETRILDTGSVDNVSFGSPSGVLEVVSSGSDGAEQTLLLRSDYSLAIGEELQANANMTSTANRDLGIAIAATAAQADGVREDYLMIFLRNSAAQIGTSGFDGTTELGLVQDFSGDTKDTLFIARTATDAFDLGFYVGGARTVVTTRTMANTSIGSAIGFYSDLRESATISGLDNLRIVNIVPEPTSLALVGLSVLGLALRRKR